MAANPLSGLERTVGSAVLQQILSSKILLVGSGGIGCELLKNLSLSGFRQVEVIDLDTIDVSNLNRQLLFRGQHVGQRKYLDVSWFQVLFVPSNVVAHSSRHHLSKMYRGVSSSRVHDHAALR